MKVRSRDAGRSLKLGVIMHCPETMTKYTDLVAADLYESR